MWRGKDWFSGEHPLGVGNAKYKARTIKRLPEEERWDQDVFKAFTAKPWGDKGQLVDSVPRTRRRYITEALIKRYGGESMFKRWRQARWKTTYTEDWLPIKYRKGD